MGHYRECWTLFREDTVLVTLYKIDENHLEYFLNRDGLMHVIFEDLRVSCAKSPVTLERGQVGVARPPVDVKSDSVVIQYGRQWVECMRKIKLDHKRGLLDNSGLPVPAHAPSPIRFHLDREV